jgi:TonB family protein
MSNLAISCALLAAAAASLPSGDQTFGPRPLHPENWFEKADYPPSARVDRKGGITRIALSIDAKGKPYRCAIEQSAGQDALDNKACEIMLRRGHFIPAKDADGSPLPSRWSKSINWRMFGTDQAEGPVADLDVTVKTLPAGQMRATFSVSQTVAADGHIEKCVVFNPSKVASIDAKGCQIAAALALQGPLTDIDDHPVRGIRIAMITVVPEGGAK